MWLGFTHRAFEAEHETIIEVDRIVKAIFVCQESCCHPAQLNEAMPLRRFARKARCFQSHDDTGLAKRYLAHQLLKAVACRRGNRCGFAEVAVDHPNTFDRPTGCNCPITQRILSLCALIVLGNLTWR